MTDRELLERAAKAIGHGLEWVSVKLDDVVAPRLTDSNPFWFNWPRWNPLADDGDVFRLCVDLGIRLTQHLGMVIASFPFVDGVNLRKTLCEEILGDRRKASRRAAVRAAAAIGEVIEYPNAPLPA